MSADTFHAATAAEQDDTVLSPGRAQRGGSPAVVEAPSDSGPRPLGKRLTKWLGKLDWGLRHTSSWFDQLAALKHRNRGKPIKESQCVEASRRAISAIIREKKLVPILTCKGAAVEYSTPQSSSDTPQPSKGANGDIAEKTSDEDDEASTDDEQLESTREEPFLFRVPGQSQPTALVDLVDVASDLLDLIEPWAHTLSGSARKLFERKTIQRQYKDAWDNAYFDHRRNVPHGEKQRGRLNFVFGNPGIGKSWSLLHFLRLALMQGEMVLFTSAKKDTHWLFLPDTSLSMRIDPRDNLCTYKGGYTVYKWSSNDDVACLHKHLPLLESCVWIIDPYEFQLGKPLHKSIDEICPVANVRARLFTAVSDNEQHVENLFEKYTDCARYVADMWTWQELQQLPSNFFSITPTELKNRFSVVGGSLWYLNKQYPYELFVARMHNVKVNGAQLEQLLLAERPLGAGRTLKHSAIMKLTSSGIRSKYEFLSARAEELHADTLRGKVSVIRFGELNHRVFEPLVRHDLSVSITTPLRLIALQKGKVGKAFRLVNVFGGVGGVEISRQYPVNQDAAFAVLANFNTPVGTLLIMPTGCGLLDFALKISDSCWMLVQATTSQRHSYNLTDFYTKCSQNVKGCNQYIMVWAVNGATASKFPWIAPEGLPPAQGLDIFQYAWCVRGTPLDKDTAETPCALSTLSADAKKPGYFISDDYLRDINSIVGKAWPLLASPEIEAKALELFKHITKDKLFHWIKKNVGLFSVPEHTLEKGPIAVAVVRASFGKEAGRVLDKTTVDSQEEDARKLAKLGTAKLQVFLESLVCQDASDVASWQMMSRAEYEALCVAALALFAKDSGGTENDKNLKRVKRDRSARIKALLSKFA